MKKISSLLILFITLNSFSQQDKLVSKISEINDLYLNQKYDQVISESKKIFSEVYGPVDDRNKLRLIPLVANSHIILENYSKAFENYNRYKEIYLKFDIKGLSLKQKEKALKSVNKTIADLKVWIPENEITTTNPKNNNTQSDSKNIVELVTSSNEESDRKNTVELVTSSNGKSRSEAIKFALRDALEQSFGTFISSNTKIMNDEIVNDEIVSVNSGNILNYDVISESQLLDELYTVSVRSTVSLTSLTSYMQNKGHKISFSGESFGMKIKLQKLNEQSETKVIDNMIVVLRKLIIKSIDFKIVETSEPVLKTNFKGNEGEELYNVIVKVSSYPNKNYDSFKNFMLKTLRNISMSNIEIEEYSKLKKDVSRFIVFNEENMSYPTSEVLKKFNPINPSELKKLLRSNTNRISNVEFNNLDFKTNGKKNVTRRTKELIIENLKHFKEVSSHNLQIVSKGSTKGSEKYFDNPWYISKINENIKLISRRREVNDLLSYPISSNGNIDLRLIPNDYSAKPEFKLSWSYEVPFVMKRYKSQWENYLRNHDIFTFRSINSLKKIDSFLKETQELVFGFSLEFGDFSWTPFYDRFDYENLDNISEEIIDQIPNETKSLYKTNLLNFQKSDENILDYYRAPYFGLPAAHKDFFNGLNLGKRRSKSNYRDLARYQRYQPRTSYTELLSKLVNKNRREKDEDIKELFFTNLIYLYRASEIRMGNFNESTIIEVIEKSFHEISLKLTLSELENIQDFKVNNLNYTKIKKLKN
jgi:hypothetical protein